MADPHRPTPAAARLAAAERDTPGALELAALVPQAARIERRLLRELRLQLLPHRHAADEAELWASDLVELRALDGLVLRADVQELLRGRARALLQGRSVRSGARAERSERLRRAHRLLLQHHAGAPPLMQLEEEVAWLAMASSDAPALIQQRLEVALAALVRDGRVGVARWAARALPRLPEVARGTRAAWLLSVAAADRLPAAGRAPGLRPPGGLGMVDLAALAPHLGQAALGVRRLGDRLELGAVGPGGAALMVPASEPRFVTLGAAEGEGEVDVAVPAGALHERAVGWEPLRLRSADGRQWILPVLGEQEQGWLEGITVRIRRESRGAPAAQFLGTITTLHDVVTDPRPVVAGETYTFHGPGGSLTPTYPYGRVPGHLHIAPGIRRAAPLPLAAGIADDARVVSLGIDARGVVHPVVGRWSDDTDSGPTVRARTQAPAEGCLGAPVVVDGRLAGVVTRVHEESDAAGTGPAGGALRLYLDTRREVLLGGAGASPPETSRLTIELLPAAQGTAVLVGWGPARARRYLLVDGGPRRTAKAVIARVRRAIGADGRLELIVISHADADRVEGIVELLAAGVTADDIWFNGPLALGGRFGIAGAHSRVVGLVEQQAQRSGLRMNAAFSGLPIVAEPEGALPRVELPGGAAITVLGPAPRALAALAPYWNQAAARRAALDEKPGAPAAEGGAPGDDAEPAGEEVPEKPGAAGRQRAPRFGTDRSANNGASLVLLFEYGGRTLLLPGDAHAAPLLEAVRRLAAQRGRTGLFVDVFLLPHAGSRANVTPELIDTLEAGTYAVSTDGSIFHHPDAETIELIARRHPGSTLVFNHRSETTARWSDKSVASKYKLKVIYPEAPGAGVELSLVAGDTAQRPAGPA